MKQPKEITCTRCNRNVKTEHVTEFRTMTTGRQIRMPTKCWTNRGCEQPPKK